MRTKQRSYSFSNNWDSNQRLYYDYSDKSKSKQPVRTQSDWMQKNKERQSSLRSSKGFGSQKQNWNGKDLYSSGIKNYYNDVPCFGSNVMSSQPKYQEPMTLGQRAPLCLNTEINNQYRQRTSVPTSQLQKVNQQKLCNIDRINSKIKGILETLNQEQRRMTGKDDRRLRTEGGQSFSSQSSTIGRIKQNIQPIPNDCSNGIYGKLLTIKQKYSLKQNTNQNLTKNSSYKDITNIEGQKNKCTDFTNSYNCGFYDERRGEKRDDGMKRNILEMGYQNIPYERRQKEEKLDYSQNQDYFDLRYGKYRGKYEEERVNENFPETRKFGIKSNVKSSQYRVKTCGDQSFVNNNPYSYQFLQQKKSIYNPISHTNSPNLINNYSNDQNNYHHKFSQQRTNCYNTPQKSRVQRKSMNKQNSSIILSNGKDIDIEINKIQDKIQNAIDIRRMLQEPEQEQNKFSSQNMCKSLLPSPPQYHNKLNKNHERNIRFEHNNEENKNLRTSHEDLDISFPKPFKLSTKRNRLIENNSQVKYIQSALISENRVNYKDYSHISNCTSHIFEYNPSSLDNYQSITKSKMNEKLLRNLCEQVQLDSKFRNCKKWFFKLENERSGKNKWIELSEELRKKNINTNMKQNREIFDLPEEEDNPFLTLREEDGSYRELVESFIQCEKNWLQNMQGKFLDEQVERAIRGMDLDRNDKIDIEDVVRFINFECDESFRNRDLVLVYKRLASNQTFINKTTLKNELTKQ